jgi:FtsZ-binding cell division protein ZapB
MSIQKSELQAAMATNIGASIEDRKEAVQKEIQQYDGASQALSQAMKSLEGLFQHVDKDVEEGKYEGKDGPLEVASVAKDYIKKAIGLLDNLATSSKIQGVRARGKAEGVQAAMDVVKKIRDRAEAKVKGALETMESGQVEVEVLPLRRTGNDFPIPSAAADIQARREEARKSKETKEEAPQAPPEAVSEDSTKETVAPPKRRPGRPKGSKNKDE